MIRKIVGAAVIIGIGIFAIKALAGEEESGGGHGGTSWLGSGRYDFAEPVYRTPININFPEMPSPPAFFTGTPLGATPVQPSYDGWEVSKVSEEPEIPIGGGNVSITGGQFERFTQEYVPSLHEAIFKHGEVGTWEVKAGDETATIAVHDIGDDISEHISSFEPHAMASHDARDNHSDHSEDSVKEVSGSLAGRVRDVGGWVVGL